MCPRHHSGSHLVPTKGHTEDRVSREKLRTIDIADGWASLVAQMVKYSPAMQETRVRSLGWKDPLEEGLATHSSILAWRIHMDRGAWWPTLHHGVPRVRHD